MGTNQSAITYAGLSSNSLINRLLVQPLDPTNDFFPFNLSVGTMMMNFSNFASNTTNVAYSAANTSTYYFGLYTRVNSTQLSLVNSASASVGMAANVSNYLSLNGARWLSFHSSLFSVAPVLSANTRYFFAWMARSAGATYSSNSIGGLFYGQSAQRSGVMGVDPGANSSNTSLYAWFPFMGVHSLTTHTSMPVSIANSDINKASVYANFIPHLIFNGGGGQI